MNDFELAARMVHNRFDLVLIASERMRELHRQRRERVENGQPYNIERRTPAQRAIADIEEGTVGREYLLKVKERATVKRKLKFDHVKS